MRLEFEESTHTYHLDGRPVPSVTQVLSLLEDWSTVPPPVLEAARRFGQHVHAAVALDVRGTLDWSSLDPALVPHVEAWRRFRAESGLSILASELQVAHPQYQYAGTLDVYGVLRGKRCIIDIKSGAMPRTVGAQTAAYEVALERWAGIKSRKRFCLQLSPEFPTGYKLHPLCAPVDWSNFLSALNVWRFRNAA